METISRVIVSLVYYNSLVRDTLEYTLNKPDGFDTKYYDYKRNGIVNEIKLNTPLKVFLDQNGEKGEDWDCQEPTQVKMLPPWWQG